MDDDVGAELSWSDASSDADDIAEIESLSDFQEEMVMFGAAEDLDMRLPPPIDSSIYDDGQEHRENTPQPIDHDLRKDLEETCAIKTPLQMRYNPDGTHCIATWNINNGFNTQSIVKTMLHSNISILFLQEPKQLVTKIDAGFINKALLQYGLKGHFTKYQFMIYNEATLGARVQDVKSSLEGRLITCNVQVGNCTAKKYIKIIGCYAVPQGNKIYKDGSTRIQHRKTLYDRVKKLFVPSNPIAITGNGYKSPGKHIVGEMLLGDLQETMTTTIKDNAGGTKYKRLEFGILKAITDSNKKMRSAVFEKEGPSYITRVPLSGAEKGGRGISHIMIDNRMEDRYVGGCIDPLLSKSTCGTADHFIVAAEFNLGITNFHLLN